MNWYAYKFLVTERVESRRSSAQRARVLRDGSLRGWFGRVLARPASDGLDVAARGPGSAEGAAAAAVTPLAVAAREQEQRIRRAA